MVSENEELDDLGEILCNFPSEDEDDGNSRTNEFFDIIEENKLQNSPPKKKRKSNPSVSVEPDSSCFRDETQGKFKLLKETQKGKRKSSAPDCPKEKNMTFDGPVSSCCKHGKPKEVCFFCNQTLDNNDEVVIKEKESPLKKGSIYEQSGKNNAKTSGIKKDRVAHKPKSPAGGAVDAGKTKHHNQAKESTKDLRKNQSSTYTFGGIEVMNPLVSSTVLEERMKGRRLVKISKIQSTMKNNDIEGDWVTIGVLVKKITQKTGSNGKNFSVWHLSDLGLGTENIVVAFFLFGDVNKEHWKTQESVVIGLLNPTIMKKDKEKTENGVAITIDNPKKLMEIGFSKDLGTCKGVRKSDSKVCGMFINKKYGDYCEYHVQKAFKKAKSGRSELQSGGAVPKKCKSKMMNKIKNYVQNGEYHYGGRKVTLSDNRGGTKNQVKMKSVGTKQTGLGSLMSNDIKVLATKECKETKIKKEKEKLLAGGSEEFKELLQVPTIGSRNLIHLLDENRVKEEENQKPASRCFSARSFLRSNKSELLPSIAATKNSNQNNKRKLCDLHFFDDNNSVSKQKSGLDNDSLTEKSLTKKIPQVKNREPRQQENKNTSRDQQNNCKEEPAGKTSFKELIRSQGATNRPVIGRGLRISDYLEFEDTDFSYDKYTGDEVKQSCGVTFNLNGIGNGTSLAHTNVQKQSAERKILTNISKAKLKAISLVKHKGPLQADNPNEVPGKKKVLSIEKIERKVEKNIQEDMTEETQLSEQKGKKGMLANALGTIDFNSEKTRNLLKTKSKNNGAIKLIPRKWSHQPWFEYFMAYKKAEAEREEKYFNGLEKKERMEEKLMSVTEMKVTCYACRDCRYLAESTSTLCKTEGHKVIKVPNVVKRFFACKSCKHRCTTYNKLLPKNPCAKCGDVNFEKTSMAYERSGPKIGAETLQIRGREQKFLNSTY